MRNLEVELNRIIKSAVIVLIAACLVTVFSGLIKAKKTVDETKKQSAYTHRPNESQSLAFRLVWKDLIKSSGANKITFKGKNSPISDMLNSTEANASNIDADSYFTSYGLGSADFVESLKNNVRTKFSKEASIELKEYQGIIIYALTNKSFAFPFSFDELAQKPFNSVQNVKYFGFNWLSSDNLKTNAQVLFYNNDNDFAIKLLSKKDELILYRTSAKKNPCALYKDVTLKEQKSKSEKSFLKYDTLSIPHINVQKTQNCSEITSKEIENMDKTIIALALDEFEFNLDKCGLNSVCDNKAEKNVDSNSFDEYKKGRDFDFSKNFVLFLKEKNAKEPYYTLFVDDSSILVN